jgi:hypothetical protein
MSAPNTVRVAPAVLRADESGAVVLTICGGDTTLLTSAQARRLAEMLIANADQADTHAAALRSPEAKAFDATHGHALSRA